MEAKSLSNREYGRTENSPAKPVFTFATTRAALSGAHIRTHRKLFVQREPSPRLAGEVSPSETLIKSLLRRSVESGTVNDPFIGGEGYPRHSHDHSSSTPVPEKQQHTTNVAVEAIVEVRSIGCQSKIVQEESHKAHAVVATQTLPQSEFDNYVTPNDILMTTHLLKKVYEEKTATLEKNLLLRRNEFHKELEEQEVRHDHLMSTMEARIKEMQAEIDSRERAIVTEREQHHMRRDELLKALKESGEQNKIAEGRIADLTTQLSQLRRVNALQEALIKKRNAEDQLDEKAKRPTQLGSFVLAGVKSVSSVSPSQSFSFPADAAGALNLENTAKPSASKGVTSEDDARSESPVLVPVPPKEKSRKRRQTKGSPSEGEDFGTRLSRSKPRPQRSQLFESGAKSPTKPRRRISVTSAGQVENLSEGDDSRSVISASRSHSRADAGLRKPSSVSHSSPTGSSLEDDDGEYQMKEWEAYKEAIKQLPPTELFSAIASQQWETRKTMMAATDKLCYLISRYEEVLGVEELRGTEDRVREALEEVEAEHLQNIEELRLEVAQREEEMKKNWSLEKERMEAALAQKEATIHTLQVQFAETEKVLKQRAEEKSISVAEAVALSDQILELQNVLLNVRQATSSSAAGEAPLCGMCQERLCDKAIFLQYKYHKERHYQQLQREQVHLTGVDDRHPWGVDPVQGVLLRSTTTTHKNTKAGRPSSAKESAHQRAQEQQSKSSPQVGIHSTPGDTSNKILCHPHTHPSVLSVSNAFMTDRSHLAFTTAHRYQPEHSLGEAIPSPRPVTLQQRPTSARSATKGSRV